ncbi:cupin domain-containing protein [Variovorax sp. EBFNA2]|uniref:cupin domain-containing protein n=1 Tax=Variovorax sp. EBFNA2 TaxID=3342097 RepID=UPI0029C01353|nr:cupin domain-containing protein [Variovorax boronicumulans]WPG41089.1 cupin domain-containing protein [Variovorax boronicumulans]
MSEVLETSPSRYDTITHVDELIRAIDAQNCTPGWVARPQPLMWPAPRSKFVPVHWRYAEIRPALLAAGRVIGTDLAERRNFVLRNPIEGNDFATTRTLVGAYQSILPGERARSHRHSSHALRVIIESQGSYSVVNGKRHPMETGDIVLTPGNHWHGHGHDGDAQAFWFDCLDLPLVHLLEPMKAEDHPEQWEQNAEQVDHSPMRIEWADTERRLAATDAGEGGDAFFGKTVDVTSALMPTITIKVHHWAAGWQGKAYRRHANAIYVVLRGCGVSAVGDERFSWSFGDVFVAPLGVRVAHAAHDDAVLVALTDEGLMAFCGYDALEACE